MEMSRRAAALSNRGAARTDRAPAAPPPTSELRPAASIAEASRPPRVARVAPVAAIAATGGRSALIPETDGFVGERITVDCNDGPTRRNATFAMVLILALFAAAGIFLF